MSVPLTTAITQVRWPLMTCANGNSAGIRITRTNPGFPDAGFYEPVATAVLKLIGNQGPVIMNGLDLIQRTQTSQGKTANDGLVLEFRDVSYYTGTVNGISQSEDFSSAGDTFFGRFFNDKPPNTAITYKYNIHLDWCDSAGNLIEIAFIFQYDPNYKPQTGIGTRNPGRKILGVATTPNATWQDVLNLIGPSDCIQGAGYAGFLSIDNTWHPAHGSGGIDGGTKSPFGNTSYPSGLTSALMQATPFQNGTDSILYNSAFTTHSGTPGDPYWPSQGGQTNWGSVLSWWGPSGTWWINLGVLFGKIAQASRFDTFAPSTDLNSPLTWYLQAPDVTHFCYPIDAATGTNARDIYISVNAFFGSHPFDGRQWLNPVAFKPDQPIPEVLQSLCNFILADYEIGVQQSGGNKGKGRLLTSGIGDFSGSIPTKWVQADIGTNGFVEIEPATAALTATVSNLGDPLKVISPANDSATVEWMVPIRTRQWGSTVHQSTSSAMNEIDFLSTGHSGATDLTGTSYGTIFDGSLTQDPFAIFNMQGPSCFRTALADANGAWTPNMDCWKALCFAMKYDATGTAHNPYSGLASKLKNPLQNGPNTSTWANSFWALGAAYKTGDTVVPNETHCTRFNSVVYHAEILGTFKIQSGLTILQTDYDGVKADDGTLTGATLGITESIYYDCFTRTFRAIEWQRNLRDAVTSAVKLQDIPTNNFPAIDGASYKVLTGSASGSSTTGSNTSSAIIIGGDPLAGTRDWNDIYPAALVTNTSNWVLGQAGKTRAWITATTDINLDGITGGFQGSRLILLNTGTHFIKLINSTGSSAANQFLFFDPNSHGIGVGVAGAVELLYDSVVSKWRVLSVR